MYLDNNYCSFRIRETEYSFRHEGILDIALFGSVLRGEDDEYSDIDLLVIVDSSDPVEIDSISDRLSVDLDMPKNYFTMVSMDSLIASVTKGVMFFWAMKIDSLIIYSRNGFLQSELDRLTVFKKEFLINEISSVRGFLNSYNDFSISNEDDLLEALDAILYALKFLCTCPLIPLRDLTFNKYDIVKRCIFHLKDFFPFSFEEYTELVDLCARKKPIDMEYDEYVIYISKWIDYVNTLTRLCVVLANQQDEYVFEYKR